MGLLRPFCWWKLWICENRKRAALFRRPRCWTLLHYEIRAVLSPYNCTTLWSLSCCRLLLFDRTGIVEARHGPRYHPVDVGVMPQTLWLGRVRVQISNRLIKTLWETPVCFACQPPPQPAASLIRSYLMGRFRPQPQIDAYLFIFPSHQIHKETQLTKLSFKLKSVLWGKGNQVLRLLEIL